MRSTRPASAESRGPGRPRDEDVRKRMLEAASDLLQEVGFGSITVDAIAERAGASKATVYRWWPDKSSLLIEAFRAAVQPEFPFAYSGSLAHDLQTQLGRFTEFLQGGRGRLLSAMIVGAQQDPEMAKALREFWIAPLRERGYEVLDRYRQSGDLPHDLDLDLIQDVMYAPLYYNMMTGYTPISEAYARQLTRVVLKAFASTDAFASPGLAGARASGTPGLENQRAEQN